MIESWKRAELAKLREKYKLNFSKALGQNFLTDGNTLEKITTSADLNTDDHVIEIGPGAGALTVFLAEAAEQVTAIEIDKRLMPVLRDVTEGLSNVEIVNEDFLEYKLPSSNTPYKLVGNLPYYITTPIIAKIFEPERVKEGVEIGARPVPPTLAVFMMQKEVAERLISPPGKKTYGAISVLVQYYTEAEMLFTVSREVFIPKPGVDSAVIRLKPRDLSGDDPVVTEKMFRLVRSGFNKRRKTLRNSLSDSGFSEEALLNALEKAGIDPIRRAETLSPRDFYTVASFL
jgi:dimethyladenosine transferase